MTSKTVFPTVEVEKLRVKSGSDGVTKEDRIGGIMDDFTPETVEDLIDGFEEMVGPLGDDFEVEYTLLIKGFSRKGVKAKARGFVRFKNPFEPSLLSMESMNKTGMNKLLGKTPIPDYTIYRVKVSVSK